MSEIKGKGATRHICSGTALERRDHKGGQGRQAGHLPSDPQICSTCFFPLPCVPEGALVAYISDNLGPHFWVRVTVRGIAGAGRRWGERCVYDPLPASLGPSGSGEWAEMPLLLVPKYCPNASGFPQVPHPTPL